MKRHGNARSKKRATRIKQLAGWAKVRQQIKLCGRIVSAVYYKQTSTITPWQLTKMINAAPLSLLKIMHVHST